MAFSRFLRPLKYGIRPALYWARCDVRNWGDDVNPWLFRKLTGLKPVFCPHIDISKLLMGGSILHLAGPADRCWGTGFIDDRIGSGFSIAQVHALRGPLTGLLLEKNGMSQPSVFGDPGILAADFISLDLTKQSRIGVIPHYCDQNNGRHLADALGAVLIPVSLPTEEFVRRIAQMERVISSSLHGLICAESIGIPATWVRFSDDVIGGDFKFHDYLAGTDRKTQGISALDLRRVGTLDEVRNARDFPAFDRREVKLRLLRSFPLGRSSALNQLLSSPNALL